MARFLCGNRRETEGPKKETGMRFRGNGKRNRLALWWAPSLFLERRDSIHRKWTTLFYFYAGEGVGAVTAEDEELPVADEFARSAKIGGYIFYSLFSSRRMGYTRIEPLPGGRLAFAALCT